MNNLLIQLEKESIAINLASGLKLAQQIAKDLDSTKKIIQRVKDFPQESIQILEKVEEVVVRPIDENHVNPYDTYVFSLLLILKELYYLGIDDSCKFNIAETCVSKMKNSYWSLKVKRKNFLEIMYDKMQISRTDAIDEVYDTIPDLLSERQFDAVNQILIDMDLKRINNSIMYSFIHMTSRYVDYLPHYKEFWQQVYNEFFNRQNGNDPTQIRDNNQINQLLLKYKDGPSTFPKFNLENDKPRKSHEEEWNEKLQSKIEMAQKNDDKDLADILKFYDSYIKREKKSHEEFSELLSRLGEKEIKRQTIAALRAMADKLENKGSEIMIYCELPSLPIFSGKDDIEKYSSKIEVCLVAGPLGG